MNILVAYATRHGSTVGIAERIAATLTEAGLPAEARPVGEIDSVDQYDAVIIGGAAYMYHWLKDATSFAKHHRKELRERPVWLFSSGPLGTDLVDKEGRRRPQDQPAQGVRRADRPPADARRAGLLRRLGPGRTTDRFDRTDDAAPAQSQGRHAGG